MVIGGNTLARGLTLHGLVCSYFVRASNAYDTLLQMGRWFGYRRGYADLVRIWMTEDLEEWFFDLATVEEEIRQDIRRYEIELLTPLELSVRIKTHPAMMITNAAKMRDAVEAEVTFSKAKAQTILFEHRNKAWLDDNLTAAGALLDNGVEATGREPVNKADGRSILRGMPVDLIVDFLGSYSFHKDSHRLRKDLLTDYIRAENARGALLSWSVVVVGDGSADKGELQLGQHVRVNRIHRSRLDMPNRDHANIKTLVSRIDRVADLDLTHAESIEAAGQEDDDKLRLLREDLLGLEGLLCLYPIAADSKPRQANRTTRPGAKRRVSLDAVADVVGVGLFFPRSRDQARVTYMTADLSDMVPERSDDELIAALDDADEAAAAAQEAAHPRTSGVRR